MQARASAIDQLVEAGILEVPGLSAGDPIARQLTQLDTVQVVEEQLAVMRRQLSDGRLAPPAGA